MKKIFFILTSVFLLFSTILSADETNTPILTTLNTSTYTAVTMPNTASSRNCKSVSAWTEDGTAWYYAVDSAGTIPAKMVAGLVPNFGCNKDTLIVFYAKATAGTPVLVTFVGAPQ